MDQISCFHTWLLAIRPKTLLASLSPVLVGGALAWSQGCRNMATWVLTALTAMLLQAIANVANDYFDYKHGYDLPGRSGPVRITQSGLASQKTVVAILVIMSLAAVILGLLLVWRGGWPILLAGVVSLAFAFLYSAGPWPLASHAMGEAASIFFFGLVAGGGTYYLQTKSINITVLVLSLTPGLLIACIMLVNNYRDMEHDRQSGKITLANLLGAERSQTLYVGMVVMAYLIVAVTVAVSAAVFLPAMLALFSLPLALKVINDMYTKTGRDLNATLTQTALLAFITSLLLGLGLILQ